MNRNFSFCTYFIAFYMVVIPAFPWSSQPTRTYTEHTKEIIGCVSWKCPIQQQTHTPPNIFNKLRSYLLSWLEGWEPALLTEVSTIPKQQLSKGMHLSKSSPWAMWVLWYGGGCGSWLHPGWRTEVLPPWTDMGGDHPNMKMKNVQGWRSANPRGICQPQGWRFSSKPKEEDPHIPETEIHSQFWRWGCSGLRDGAP